MKKFWAAVRDIWWERQRNTDLNILWPACKAQTPDVEVAKVMFTLHAIQEPAWIEFYGKEKLIDFVDTLE